MAYNYVREVEKARKWAEREEKRKDRERRQAEARERRDRLKGVIVSGAITLTGAYGEVTSLPQSGDSPLRDESQAMAQNERDNRTRGHREATRTKGRGSSSSSQQG